MNNTHKVSHAHRSLWLKKKITQLYGRSAPATGLFVWECVVKMRWDLKALCTIRATGRWGSDVLAELKGLATGTEQICLMLTLSQRPVTDTRPAHSQPIQNTSGKHECECTAKLYDARMFKVVAIIY